MCSLRLVGSPRPGQTSPHTPAWEQRSVAVRAPGLRGHGGSGKGENAVWLQGRPFPSLGVCFIVYEKRGEVLVLL